MGLQATPAWCRSLSTPETTDRNLLKGIFQRSGVLTPTSFRITPTANAREFSISGGRAYVNGQEDSLQGGYFVWSDGVDTRTLAAPSASPRIDTLLLRVWDDQYGTITGSTRADWDIIQGVAASSPTARADSYFLSGGGGYVPGAWFRVADIRINPSDTTIPSGQVYETREGVHIPGAVTNSLSAANTAGYGGPPGFGNTTGGVGIGDEVYEIDTQYKKWWNGSAFRYMRGGPNQTWTPSSTSLGSGSWSNARYRIINERLYGTATWTWSASPTWPLTTIVITGLPVTPLNSFGALANIYVSWGNRPYPTSVADNQIYSNFSAGQTGSAPTSGSVAILSFQYDV